MDDVVRLEADFNAAYTLPRDKASTGATPKKIPVVTATNIVASNTSGFR